MAEYDAIWHDLSSDDGDYNWWDDGKRGGNCQHCGNA